MTKQLCRISHLVRSVKISEIEALVPTGNGALYVPGTIKIEQSSTMSILVIVRR